MQKTDKNNTRLFRMLVLGALGMFAFGFALVPLYDVLCEQLGINGKTQNTASSAPDLIDTSRLVTVEFVSQVQSDMPWKFTPKVNQIKVHPGELVQTHFSAINLSSNYLVGQAIPSVSPGQGAAYFNKTECFCFNQQALDANGTADLGLVFYVDPNLPATISTLTLSYTLFNITDKGYVNSVKPEAEL